MNTRPLFRAAAGAAFLALTAIPSRADLLPQAHAALAGDSEAANLLRAAGPQGMEAIMQAGAPDIAALTSGKTRLDDPASAGLRAAIDRVAGQRDAFASGLYWFTDIEVAKAESAKTGRRILSLRLLGKLDEEYCCANSRFFRTVLYANKDVSRLLRQRYVLHWKSVRPAPLLTIDMGDGRRIKRTITGNSIHYLLNAEGHVLDALPGIYSPAAFMAALARAEHHAANRTPKEQQAWHGREAHTLCMEWLAAAVRAGAYGPDASKRMDDPSSAEQQLHELAVGAFPAGSGLQAAAPAGRDQAPARPAASLRFGVNGLPESMRQVPVIERIQPFPFPSDFDPPKGMVERPIMKNALPGGQANAALDPATPARANNSPSDQPAPGQKGSASAKESSFPVVPTTPVSLTAFPYPTEFDPPQVPKGMVERPIMKKALPGGKANAALDPASPALPGVSLAGRMTPVLWEEITAPYRGTVRLDEASRRFMMQKLPADALLPEEVTTGGPVRANSPFARLLQRFEDAIARDMVRNEFYYHTHIHQWLEDDRDGVLRRDVEALNRRVYAELFLTPDYDAWLGLVPEDTYTALEKDGCACDKGAPPMRQPTVQR